jgi:hypothetical protein
MKPRLHIGMRLITEKEGSLLNNSETGKTDFDFKSVHTASVLSIHRLKKSRILG